MKAIILKQANNTNFVNGRKEKIKFIVVHYTANNGDTAAGNCNYFAGANRKASANYFVDENSFMQSVLDTDTAWHCGGGLQGEGGHSFYKTCSNSNSIGIEMCSKKINGQYVITEQTQRNTIELVKMLMEKHVVSLSNVIRHFDVTGKICPEPFVRDESQWVRFKNLLVGEDEMITETDIIVNGELKKVVRIMKDGENFIRLRDCDEILKMCKVDYDAVQKCPRVSKY